MSASDQTDEQRRELRIKQRHLKHLIQDERSVLCEQMADVASGKFQKVRKENNKLWTEVRFTREAVLDADNVEIISARAARQTDQLVNLQRYDATQLVTKLRGKFSVIQEDSSFFNWKTFGFEVGSCFNAVPCNVSFLNGPIGADEYEAKPRKKRARKEMIEDIEEVQIASVKQKKKSKDENSLSAAEKQVKDITKCLQNRSVENEQQKIEQYEKKFINPVATVNFKDAVLFMKKLVDNGILTKEWSNYPEPQWYTDSQAGDCQFWVDNMMNGPTMDAGLAKNGIRR